MDLRGVLQTARIVARCAAFTAAGLLLPTLPARAESAFSPQLEPLVQTYLSGQGTSAMKARVDAYVAAHPNDGNGLALQCAVDGAIAYARKSDVKANVLAALVECQKALAIAPQSAFVNFVNADEMYDAGGIAESIPYYSKAIDLGMTEGGIFWKRCDAYRRTNDLTKALADCKRQLELTPTSFYALYAYGHLQYARAQYADAASNLSLALSVNPESIEALYWRGMTYASLGKFAQAEADFTRCIALGDESPDTYFERGQARRNLGETSQATADLQEALTRYRANGMTAQANVVEGILGGAASGAQHPANTALASRTLVVDGVSFEAADVAKLLGGVKAAFSPTDHSVHIALSLKPAGDMPAYDPQWHYVGAQRLPDGTPSIDGWVLATLPQDQLTSAFEAIALLGLADSGYAGPNWKALYDRFAAEDAALGPTATDPFVNRRKFADQLVKLFQSVLQMQIKTSRG